MGLPLEQARVTQAGETHLQLPNGSWPSFMEGLSKISKSTSSHTSLSYAFFDLALTMHLLKQFKKTILNRKQNVQSIKFRCLFMIFLHTKARSDHNGYLITVQHTTYILSHIFL